MINTQKNIICIASLPGSSSRRAFHLLLGVDGCTLANYSLWSKNSVICIPVVIISHSVFPPVWLGGNCFFHFINIKLKLGSLRCASMLLVLSHELLACKL